MLSIRGYQGNNAKTPCRCHDSQSTARPEERPICPAYKRLGNAIEVPQATEVIRLELDPDFHHPRIPKHHVTKGGSQPATMPDLALHRAVIQRPQKCLTKWNLLEHARTLETLPRHCYISRHGILLPLHELRRHNMSLLFPRAFQAFFPELATRQLPRSLAHFEPFAGFPRQFESAMHDRTPALDLHETEQAYRVEAELPGVRKEDLKLNFSEDGSTLTLSGQIKRPFSSPSSTTADSMPSPADQSSSNDGTTSSVAAPTQTETAVSADATHQPFYSERWSGTFARSLRFPQLVDSEGTKASLVDGVLSIVVPKRVGTQKAVQIE